MEQRCLAGALSHIGLFGFLAGLDGAECLVNVVQYLVFQPLCDRIGLYFADDLFFADPVIPHLRDGCPQDLLEAVLCDCIRNKCCRSENTYTTDHAERAAQGGQCHGDGWRSTVARYSYGNEENQPRYTQRRLRCALCFEYLAGDMVLAG